MPCRAFWALISSVGVSACGTEAIELAPVPAQDEASSLPAPPANTDGSGPPTVTVPGCQAVDFLFVVDNSLSMRDEQANLALSFPRFIEIAQQTLQTNDYHIMVVTTDGDLLERDGAEALDASDCEEVLGAGRRQNLAGDDCGIEGGAAFMTASQPNLSETFSCVAQVGTDGDPDSSPMQAMLAAISPALNSPGSCNTGFFRQDAVLAVTFISDEEDEDSPGDPEDWRSLLLAAKGGNEAALVVLGLMGDENIEGGLPGGPCDGSADEAPRLQQFVESFGARGLAGSVCAGRYESFFERAVGWIDSACTELVLR